MATAGSDPRGGRPARGHPVIVLFALALALAGAGGLVSWFAIRTQLRDAAEVRRTDAVIAQIQQVRFLVVRAEAAQRSYLITPQSQVMAWYQTAVAEVPAAFEAVHLSTRDNPVQQALLGDLRPVIDQRLGQLAEGVRLVDADGPAAIAGLLAINGWRETEERWLGLVDAMIGHERSLQAINARHAAASGHTAGVAIIITTALAMLASGLGAALVHRYLRSESRRAAAESMDRDRLEAAVLERTVELEAAISGLRAANAALGQSEERFRLLVGGVRDHAIFLLDAEGRVASWNPGAEDLKQWTADEILGRHLRVFYPPEYQARHDPEANLAQAAREGALHLIGERVRKDGSRFQAEASLTALRHPDGTLRGFAKVTRDVTERHRAEDAIRRHAAELEQRVAERTTSLSGALAELDSFSYSVSHDLRAPLRAIAGFAQALEEDGGGRLDEDCRGHLGRIKAATTRMGELIDGLLELSRVSRSEVSAAVVDLSGLAGEVIADLRRADPERAVAVTIQPNIQVRGDRRLLRAALDNLLGNAWKFTGRVPSARIAVDAKPTGAGRIEVAVHDNGPGFANADAARLFVPFQRLHRDYPGTGIGLATVQRIATRHGGTVRAEAEPGRGAHFFLDLPSAD